MNTSPTIKPGVTTMLTMTTKTGLTVLAKVTPCGITCPKTYTNVKQATKAAEKAINKAFDAETRANTETA